MRRGLHRLCAALVLGLLGLSNLSRAADASAQWDLTALYATPQAWTAAYERMRSTVATLDRYKGTIGTGAESMFTALAAISDARRERWRLHGYASLRSDEDLGNAPNAERRQLAGSLLTRLGEQTAWLAPEVQALGEAKVLSFLQQSPRLAQRFDFFLLDTLRRAPHTLGLEAESVLASTGDVLARPTRIFEQIGEAELPWPTIEIAGQKVRLTQPEYENRRASDDRAVRRAVFDAFWTTYKSYRGTFGETLTTQVMGGVFSARARRFETSLQQALFDDNLPERVYRTLVAQANEGLPTLHRYLRLGKLLLGIEGGLAYYDNYPPLFRLAKTPAFSLEESRQITLSALAPMGDEYLALLRPGTAARWTDPFPRQGKRSGAYVSGAAYDVHPYVLLNHNDDYASLTTYAHEWGHAVHTLLATANQPYEKSDYSSFIGESASIANEMLLGDYLVRTAPSVELKKFASDESRVGASWPRAGVKGGRSPAKRTLDAGRRPIRWPLWPMRHPDALAITSRSASRA
jgi:oligoendopeptidase F